MKKKKLFEDDEIFGTTDAMSLSDVPADAAKAAYKGGKKDGDDADDAVPSSKVSVAAAKLKPSQKEVVPEKAVAFAILALMKKAPMESGPGGDLQAIISNDNYIMDGHHRWAATFLVDPSATMQATQIDLPGAALVTALNVVTKGLGRGGQSGVGDIAKFGGKPVEDEIRNAAENGIKGATAEEVTNILKEWGGSVDGAVKMMITNAAKMPKKIPGWAPNRVNMPVIKAPEVATIAKAIAAGAVDIKKPYSPDVKDKMEAYTKMRKGQIPLTEGVIKKLSEFNKTFRRKTLEEKLFKVLRPIVAETIKSRLKKKSK